MAVRALLMLRREIRLGLQKVETCRTIYCIVPLPVTTIAKYVVIRNTMGMNHFKVLDALTFIRSIRPSSTVLARLFTPTFHQLHVTQFSNPCGI
jgi:hypothetical protein